MEPGKRMRLRVRVDKFQQLCKERGVTGGQKEIAQYTGLSAPTISRLLAGRQVPGEIIIASLLGAFGKDKFEELFELVDDEDKVAAA